MEKLQEEDIAIMQNDVVSLSDVTNKAEEIYSTLLDIHDSSF